MKLSGGKWRGYRASRLGLQYRVICSLRAIPERSLFQVVQITPHDYGRRG